VICAWCPGFDPTADVNRGVSHGICQPCAAALENGDDMKKKRLDLRALGALGGSANSKAQQKQREQAAQLGGRPGRVCDTCGEPVRGGHKDRALDATCAGRAWHWSKPADR